MQKGKIQRGQVFSDCLVPSFIDELNAVLATGEIAYDVAGMQSLVDQVRQKFTTDDPTDKQIREVFLPEL